jgi:hypothetical protein
MESFTVPASDFNSFQNNYPFLNVSLPSTSSYSGAVTVLRQNMGLRVEARCTIMLSEPLVVDNSQADVVVECELGGSSESQGSWQVGLRVGGNTIRFDAL